MGRRLAGCKRRRCMCRLDYSYIPCERFLPKDYAGTLKQLGAIGFREVESAGYYNHSAAEVKQAMSDAGLHLVSAHYGSDDLHQKLDEILAFSKEVGVSYIICSYPGFKDPSRVKSIPAKERSNAFTLADWRWNAEQFNTIGAKVSAAGLQFGYHNHSMEFRKTDGVVPYDELLRLTDPAHVTMEMDCGWVTVGGASPIDYLKKYPTRISMLHVKDFKNITAESSIDKCAHDRGIGAGHDRLPSNFCAGRKVRPRKALFRRAGRLQRAPHGRAQNRRRLHAQARRELGTLSLSLQQI